MNEVQRITSRDNALLVKLRRLMHDGAAYRRHAAVWIEGEHLCAEARSRAIDVEQALLSESAWADAALRALAQHAPRVAVVPDALFAAISALESAVGIGFVLAARAPAAIQPRVASVVLDRLQDAGNVGAILRSAAAFGFTQVLALKGTAALWSAKVLRAGMGAHFGLHLVEGLDAQALDALQLPMVATSSHAAPALHELTLPWPCAWVMGHEGQGVSAALQTRCSLTVRIPQPGGEESLNVAAAAAVCFYESARQRAISVG